MSSSKNVLIKKRKLESSKIDDEELTFVKPWETIIKIDDLIKLKKPEDLDQYVEKFGKIGKCNRLINGRQDQEDRWKKSMNFNELKKYIDYDKLARVVEVNYFDSNHEVSTKWKFESIKLLCPKKVLVDDDEFYKQSYIEIYFELPYLCRSINFINNDNKFDYVDFFQYLKYLDCEKINSFDFEVQVPKKRKFRKINISKLAYSPGNGFFIES